MDYSIDEAGRRLITDLERAFAGIAARAGDADATGELPSENWSDIVASGYLRVFHPTEIGGLGVDGVTQVMAMETLARTCASTYWTATMSGFECVKLLQAHGGDHHRALIDQLVKGERLGCYAVVERTSGCDLSTCTTTVRQDGDRYVLSGEKARIANVTTADMAVVLSRIEGHGSGWCYAFVDMHQPGIRTYPMPHLGLRAMPWGGVVFDDVPVPAADVVSVHLSEIRSAVSWGWLFISVAAIGIAESALTLAARHARHHVTFGRALGHMEGVRDALAKTRMEIDAARLLAYRCAWHRGEGRLVLDLVGMLKPFATEMAVRATKCAIEILGSWGVTPGYPAERLYRDAPMNLFGGFSANRQREIVAEMLGIAVTYQEHDLLAGTGLDQDPTGLRGHYERDLP
ncbi:acyl-CoA dehydrogenase family protein [Amycolatopsis sp. NPDC049868]|uniref:acyl-CoA dehydrogenase family protein n=1 Tax=Amycolatopsis sp. NPDC049868 TaxID=3363934 RepID=UPI0037954322